MIRKPKLATIGIDERQDHAKGPDAQRNGSLRDVRTYLQFRYRMEELTMTSW